MSRVISFSISESQLERIREKAQEMGIEAKSENLLVKSFLAAVVEGEVPESSDHLKPSNDHLKPLLERISALESEIDHLKSSNDHLKPLPEQVSALLDRISALEDHLKPSNTPSNDHLKPSNTPSKDHLKPSNTPPEQGVLFDDRIDLRNLFKEGDVFEYEEGVKCRVGQVREWDMLVVREEDGVPFFLSELMLRETGLIGGSPVSTG